MITKEFSKIHAVKFGNGGYQDIMFGFTFHLGAVSDFWGTWATHREECKWTPDDQNKQFLSAFLRVKQLMSDAKKTDFSALAGTPIEIIYENSTLKSWRILTEVL
jgi:hypothetical protein